MFNTIVILSSRTNRDGQVIEDFWARTAAKNQAGIEVKLTIPGNAVEWPKSRSDRDQFKGIRNVSF